MMRMRDWAEYGIGLVFTSARQIEEKDEITYLVEKMGFEDVYELVEAQEPSNHCWRY